MAYYLIQDAGKVFVKVNGKNVSKNVVRVRIDTDLISQYGHPSVPLGHTVSIEFENTLPFGIAGIPKNMRFEIRPRRIKVCKANPAFKGNGKTKEITASSNMGVPTYTLELVTYKPIKRTVA